jgi:Flp pilus assembly protein TadB
MTPLLWALLLGALTALTVVVTGLALRPPAPAPPTTPRVAVDRRLARRTLEGLVAGLVVLVVTRWVVVGVAVALGVALRGRVFPGSGASAERAHVEAIALWLEGVRDALRSDASLQQVLYRVAANPPAPLADELGRFERRGRQGVPLIEALALLADDVAHPTADVAVASMTQSLELSGGRVRQQLDELAATARHELAMRERVDRIRARFDFATKAMMLLAALIIAYLWLVGRVTDYYRTPTGQVTLALPVATWVLSLAWMRHLARYELPQRVLQRDAQPMVVS